MGLSMYSMKLDGHMPNPSPTLHVAGRTIVLEAKLAPLWS